MKKIAIFCFFLVDFQIWSNFDFFSKKFIFSSIFIFSHRNKFCFKFYNFFSSESWDLIVYIARNHLANAPIFWRVSSFKGTLTNKKFAFRRQIRKMARFSSLWVEMQFWHQNRKEHPIFDLEPPWFKFMTVKTTSRDLTNKKTILALRCSNQSLDIRLTRIKPSICKRCCDITLQRCQKAYCLTILFHIT